MTGISEILVLVLLIACILILPRFFKGESTRKKVSLKTMGSLSIKIRLAIVLSLVYPLSLALFLKPWDAHLISYLSFGLLPVLIAWAIFWVLAGKKK